MGPPISSLVQAVRAVPITLCTVSKANSPGCNLMASEWKAKLQRYTRVEELVIKPNPRGAKDPRLAMEDEGRRVAAAIPSDSHIVLLDEKGKKLTSPGLAELLTRVSASGAPRIAFLIGGPHGHGPAARQRAHETVRLSDMVLNHQVAHIVLLEQLYRAWTILRGVPYHHI